MMKKILIRHAKIADPVTGTLENGEILIENGVIAARGQELPYTEDTDIVDASGKVVIPGLVDMHVHLRDPGFTGKEDIRSGCEAAASGGVTSVLCMPNTRPPVDSPDTVRYILDRARDAKANVYVTGAITCGLRGDVLCDYAALKEAGVIALSDDGFPVKNAARMTQALQQAAALGLLVTSHCEDMDIIDGGLINDGEVSRALGVKGMHRSSEDTITAREIILAETNDVPVHIAHVSTRLSVQLIREAKRRGAAVTAETCPHYFTMTEEAARLRDADYRMNPPLRTEKDRLAVLEGVADGTIDCIVTDHAPHTPEEKSDFLHAPNGVIGMETSFAASYTALVATGIMTLPELIERMAFRPARILGIRAGTLEPGAPADLALADLETEWTVDPEKSHSKARNMVYKGQTLSGRIVQTFLAGKTVYCLER